MSTTIHIDDDLVTVARERAIKTGRTVEQVIADALRHGLLDDVHKPVVPLPVFTRGTGMNPGIDPRSNSALYEILEEADSTVSNA